MAEGTVLLPSHLAKRVGLHYSKIQAAILYGGLKPDFKDTQGRPMFLESSLPRIRELLTGTSEEPQNETPCQS